MPLILRTTALALLAMVLWAPSAAADKTLVFGRAADSTFLDPAKYLDNESAMVIENIFEGLVRYADDSTRIEPAVAESWDTSPDGRVWTFRLRPGVRFSDGAPCDAAAAAFSFLRRTDPSHPFFREEFTRMDSSLKNIAGVEAPDRLTLRITLKEPYAPLLSALATHSAYLVSPAAVRARGDDFDKRPVGAGPFVLSEWVPGERIVLAANPDYYRGRPRLDRVVFKVIPDIKVRLLELKSGAIQIMDGVGPADRDEILKDPRLALDAKPGLNVGYLAMNMRKPPFDNLDVRRAVNHAINKENLVKLLFRDLAVVAKNPIPPGMWVYNDAVQDYGYDPGKARELLRKAGFPDGFSTTLWAMPVSRPYMPEPERIARAIQANLAAVGIKAAIVTHEWKTYLAKAYAGEHDMCLLGWVGAGDPDNFFSNLFSADKAAPPHASNIAFFTDPAAQDLIRAAQREPNQAIRAELYRQLQAVIHDQAPWTPLAHAYQAMARERTVQGVVHHQTGVVRFAKADMP
ncbi:MAG: ABC transporter substrate-binding protein [Thermodesulfobacteriota bacterium]